METRKRTLTDELREVKKRCGQKRARIIQAMVAPPKFTSISAALNYLKELFPLEAYRYRVPPIVWKDQLYAIVDNRTLVDRTLNKLLDEKVIRLFSLGSTFGSSDTAIVFMSDFEKAILANHKGVLIDKFMKILKTTREVRIAKEQLMEEHLLNESNIRELVQKGLLAMHRAVGSYLFSIPNCGEFAKEFVSAKNVLVQAIKKSKFGELHQSELERRDLLKNVRLPFAYVVFELIGSNHVESIKSPTGLILRSPK